MTTTPCPPRTATDEVIACIKNHMEAGVSLASRVLCYDGRYVIEIRPPDPHALGWEDHQDAFDALFEVFPHAALIGPESWILSVLHARG